MLVFTGAVLFRSTFPLGRSSGGMPAHPVLMAEGTPVVQAWPSCVQHVFRGDGVVTVLLIVVVAFGADIFVGVRRTPNLSSCQFPDRLPSRRQRKSKFVRKPCF